MKRFLIKCFFVIGIISDLPAQWNLVPKPAGYLNPMDFCFFNDSTGVRTDYFIFGSNASNYVETMNNFGNGGNISLFENANNMSKTSKLQIVKNDTVFYISHLSGKSNLRLSVDSGKTFSIYSSSISPMVETFHFLYSNYGITVDQTGMVRRYFNLNTNTATPFPSACIPSSLFLKSYSEAYIIINSKTIYETNDSGITWNPILTTTFNQNQIYFPNSNIGYIACDSGKVLKTINGGLSWGVLATGFVKNLNTVHFKNDTIGYCGGNDGTILKTNNGGISWTKEVFPSVNHIIKVQVLDKKVYAMDVTGDLFRKDIDTCDNVTKPVVSISSSANIYCFGSSLPTITGSPSGGIKYYPKYYSQITSGTWDVGYYITDPITGCSNMAVTTLTVIPSPLVTLSANQTTVCLYGNAETVTLTGTPAGGTYTPVQVISLGFPGSFPVNYTYKDTITGCSTTAYLTVYAINCVGIEEILSNDEFTISPNPFNERINIVLSTPNLNELTEIKIYNLIGTIIYSSKITHQKTEIDLSGISSGIYLVKIMSAEGSYTKKILKN